MCECLEDRESFAPKQRIAEQQKLFARPLSRDSLRMATKDTSSNKNLLLHQLTPLCHLSTKVQLVRDWPQLSISLAFCLCLASCKINFTILN